MDPLALSALSLAALVNAALPGPVMLLVVARAAEGGLRGGAMTALGALAAVALLLGVVWAVMLGAMQLGPQAFAALKVAGVVVLVLLGLRMLTASARPGPARIRRRGFGDLATAAALVLSNPVNLVFFLALVPQFVTVEAMTGARMAFVGALVLTASAIPVVAAILIGLWQARIAPRSTLWAVRAGGAAMLGFAGLVATTAI